MEKKKSTMEKLVKNFYKNKKILITGATGFKGAWLAYWLFLLKANIVGVGRKPNKNDNLFKQLNLKKKIKIQYFDIREKKKLEKLIKKFKPNLIFHLAAQPIISEGYKKPEETIIVNSIGTLNIVEICKNLKFVKSIICITSDKCYENNFSTKGFKENDKLGGSDPYSASKANAEIIVKSYLESFYLKNKKGLATGRAGNVIGGGDWSPNRLIPDCIKWIIKNKLIYLRRPHFNRPWQHVLEPLNGYLVLGYNLFKNPVKYSGPWNFGSKKNTITSVHEVVKKIIKYWGKGKVKINKKKQFYEQENLQLNINKAKEILNWSPKYSIAQSIRLTVEWYKYVYMNGSKEAEKISYKQINSYMNDKKN